MKDKEKLESSEVMEIPVGDSIPNQITVDESLVDGKFIQNI